jgi:hypothetical protein
LWEVWDALGYRRVNPHKRGSVDSLYAATSWKVDVLEKIAAKYASTSLGFISQVASVLEIFLTMLTLGRKKMRATFVFFLRLT